MLTAFDWLRRSQSGAELLATLEQLERTSHDTFSQLEPDLQPAPPHAAMSGPCLRCWSYAISADKPGAIYCPMCEAIAVRSKTMGDTAKQVVGLWGFVNRLPEQVRTRAVFGDHRIQGAYRHSDQHFLLMIRRRELQSWLQELLLYDGMEMTGMLQIFPTVSVYNHPNMGELICQIVHNQARFPLDRLRVRFFATPRQILEVHKYDKLGVINFEVADFLRMLESASVFRSVFLPDEQHALQQVLAITDVQEAQFYWGRLMGMLTPRARDLLVAWKLRNWSKAQINLFYELVDYVAFRYAD
jgi:hypothetical protein